MWILVLEAGGALLLLVFLVWWTMFSGRAPEAREHEPRVAAPARKENDTPEP
jgi:hypothetical protein